MATPLHGSGPDGGVARAPRADIGAVPRHAEDRCRAIDVANDTGLADSTPADRRGTRPTVGLAGSRAEGKSATTAGLAELRAGVEIALRVASPGYARTWNPRLREAALGCMRWGRGRRCRADGLHCLAGTGVSGSRRARRL